MKTVHAISIALLLGLAAALGAVAGTRAVTSGQAQAASAQPAAVSIAARQARLDRWQRQLHRALRHTLPKLPKLVRFPPVAKPAIRGPAFVSQARATPAPRTIYVHAKGSPASLRGHEHEHEQSDGGGHDD